MPSKRSRIARLTAAITAVTALVVAVALFAEALRLGNQTEPIVCKLGISPSLVPNISRHVGLDVYRDANRAAMENEPE